MGRRARGVGVGVHGHRQSAGEDRFVHHGNRVGRGRTAGEGQRGVTAERGGETGARRHRWVGVECGTPAAHDPGGVGGGTDQRN